MILIGSNSYTLNHIHFSNWLTLRPCARRTLHFSACPCSAQRWGCCHRSYSLCNLEKKRKHCKAIKAVVGSGFLLNFGSRALYFERRDTFKILMNEWFRLVFNSSFLFSFFLCHTVYWCSRFWLSVHFLVFFLLLLF